MIERTGEFFHSNNIEAEIGESLDSTSNFASPNLSSKNTLVPENGIANTLFDHKVDQEVLTNEKVFSDSDSNEAEEEQVEIPSMNLNYVPTVVA